MGEEEREVGMEREEGGREERREGGWDGEGGGRERGKEFPSGF